MKQMADCSRRLFTIRDNQNGCYERTADCCLTYPKIMYDYNDRNFNDKVCIYENRLSIENHYDCAIYACIFPFQIISNLIAIPLFLIGAPMKECALCCYPDTEETKSLVSNNKIVSYSNPHVLTE